jgi:hypothetical protein
MANSWGTFSYLSFPLKMIQLLQSFKIRPICVFDGMHLNAKSATEHYRFEEKLQNRKKGEQLGPWNLCRFSVSGIPSGVRYFRSGASLRPECGAPDALRIVEFAAITC